MNFNSGVNGHWNCDIRCNGTFIIHLLLCSIDFLCSPCYCNTVFQLTFRKQTSTI